MSAPIALVGLGLSAYLTYAHFQKVALACPDNGVVNCARVTSSAQSEIFGHIPVALAGLVYYVVMLALVSRWAWLAAAPWVAWLRLAGVVAGIGMVCYLVFVEAAQLHALCLYCTGVHAVTVLLFIAVLAAHLFRPVTVD